MHKFSYFDHNWLAIKINNQILIEQSKIIKGRVFDLGCGTRPYESDINLTAEQYIGVDWSNSLHGLQADITADLNNPLPILNNVADTVVSFQVLEHLCEPQIMLKEAYRILKPNGKMLLTVPFQWWIHEEPYDFFRFTRYGLEYLFKKAGFVEIQVFEVSGFWVMWILKLNYQTRRLILGPKPIKLLIKLCLIPFWLIGQLIAPILDKYWTAPQETTGYFVIASKI